LTGSSGTKNNEEERKQAMNINCLSCGFKVELDDTYEDFAGQIRCYVCNATMEIKTEKGKLKSAKPARSAARPAVEVR
jgi:hypothetical protein